MLNNLTSGWRTLTVGCKMYETDLPLDRVKHGQQFTSESIYPDNNSHFLLFPSACWATSSYHHDMFTVYFFFLFVYFLFVKKAPIEKDLKSLDEVRHVVYIKARCKALISQVGWMHNLSLLELSAHFNRTLCQKKKRKNIMHKCVYTWASALISQGNIEVANFF